MEGGGSLELQTRQENEQEMYSIINHTAIRTHSMEILTSTCKGIQKSVQCTYVLDKCIVKENKSTYVLNMNRCPVTLEVELFRNGWVWKGRRPQKGASENGRAREMN
jgi:hypothetical protein